MTATISGITVEIEQELCIGSGSCAAVAPEVFQLDGARKVEFVPSPTDIEQERLLEACELCPVDALIARRDDEQLIP